ncbi:hypothetical protein LAZ67_10003692 [Cordylochernes scorpioides]|uniref:Uncharacterized protein n=1 Tax=Cordylochernes scorpioides TaxID=51811 RepID=A0ABY6L122_9ARAC|nr:hypothetical protein LAZ67_10003692 [Cordylochernes scorpioides]
METSEALHWTRQQQQQKIDLDPEQQLYTPKIEDIATAVIEIAAALHTQDREYCDSCDKDAWRHLRLFIGQDNNNKRTNGWLVKAYIKGFPDSCQFTRGGLAFLIKNLYYEDIAVNIPNTSDLEAQSIKHQETKTSSIKKIWNFKKANWISFENTIIKAATVSIPRALIIFSMKKINMKEIAYALENTDLNKTPGPDGIHGRMISNLGKIGKEILLNIFNNS